jgi:hypothetical protein
MGNRSGYYKYLRRKKLEENTRRQFPEKYPSKKLATIALIIGITAGCASIACLLLLFL